LDYQSKRIQKYISYYSFEGSRK